MLCRLPIIINLEPVRSILLLVTTSVIFAGCVSVETTRLSNAPDNLTPLRPNQVNTYQDSSSVSCPYEEVALISTQGGGSYIGNDRLVNEAKKEAADIGANGVILSKFGESEMLLSSEPTAQVLAIYEDRPCN